MVDLSANLVDFGSFALVSLAFAEVYSRIKIRWGLRRVERAVDAFSRGQKTSGSRFLERVLVAFLSVLVHEGEDGKWHLTKTARAWGVRILGAVAELVKIRGPAGGAPLGGLDLGNLDMDQLIGVGISMLPKKQQGIAAMLAGVGLPLLKQFGGKGKKADDASSSSSNPYMPRVG